MRRSSKAAIPKAVLAAFLAFPLVHAVSWKAAEWQPLAWRSSWVPVRRPPRPTTRPRPAPARDPKRPRRASRLGTDDEFCHVLVGRPGHYTYTRCGQKLRPPQTDGHAPPPTRCISGGPVVPGVRRGTVVTHPRLLTAREVAGQLATTRTRSSGGGAPASSTGLGSELRAVGGAVSGGPAGRAR